MLTRNTVELHQKNQELHSQQNALDTDALPGVHDFARAQGHWILARMGKKVLRPGGKELTMKLVSGLQISPQDDVVEFAPGIGFTAALTLSKQPHSYVGIDAEESIVKSLSQKIKGRNILFINRNAADTQLESNSKDKVYGEAMLTMQSDHRKAEIIREAHRILKTGGMYAIHELGLIDVDDDLKEEIQRDLAKAIRVNARPLTEAEWVSLIQQEGFTVQSVLTNGMYLLHLRRIIDDEGFFRALKIGLNILTHPQARKRIFTMRKTFQKHQRHINAIAIIATKN